MEVNMGASRAMSDDEPLMMAWRKHQDTEDFKNTLKWAGESNMGQLWACFMHGWLAAGGVIDPR